MEALYKKLINHFNTFPLKVAGRLIYLDTKLNAFILAVHTTGADKTLEIAEIAWEGLPVEIKNELTNNNIGFAVKQI